MPDGCLPVPPKSHITRKRRSVITSGVALILSVFYWQLPYKSVRCFLQCNWATRTIISPCKLRNNHVFWRTNIIHRILHFRWICLLIQLILFITLLWPWSWGNLSIITLSKAFSPPVQRYFCCDNLLITISMLDNLTVLQESEWNTFIELYKYIFTQLPESYIFLRSIMRLTNCCPTYMLSVTALTIGRDVLFWPSQIHLPKCKVVEWGGQNMTLNFWTKLYFVFVSCSFGIMWITIGNYSLGLLSITPVEIAVRYIYPRFSI